MDKEEKVCTKLRDADYDCERCWPRSSVPSRHYSLFLAFALSKRAITADSYFLIHSLIVNLLFALLHCFTFLRFSLSQSWLLLWLEETTVCTKVPTLFLSVKMTWIQCKDFFSVFQEKNLGFLDSFFISHFRFDPTTTTSICWRWCAGQSGQFISIANFFALLSLVSVLLLFLLVQHKSSLLQKRRSWWKY